MSRTLLTGAVTTTGAAVALVVDGARLAWIGPPDRAGDAGAVGRVERLDGALLTPGFVDAHVHATATGLLLAGLDLGTCPDADALLDAVAAHARSGGGAVWGHGWDETRWAVPAPPTRAELDRAAGGRPVYLSRVDVHSALVSTALVERAPGAVGATGWSASGAVSAEAHHHVRRAALAALTRDQRRAAQRAFLGHVVRRGVVSVHECAGPDVSGREDLADLLALDTGVEVVGYWGEPVRDAGEAAELIAATGASGLAGDLFVDGSLGSGTAALTEPYRDAPGAGHADRGRTYLDPDALAAHVTACTRAGVQAGFHVIGDAAVESAVRAVERAAEATSPAAVRAARHRLEHVEMVDAAQAARLAALGVVASVQPAFDAAWGGPAGMYAARLGPDRALAMNPFAALLAAGVELAFGSDSPVTPVDPWAGVRAAVAHRTPGSGIAPQAALSAHTAGGRRAARDDVPHLVPGAPATFCLWDGNPMTATGVGASPRCLRAVARGRVLYDALGAEPRSTG